MPSQEMISSLLPLRVEAAAPAAAVWLPSASVASSRGATKIGTAAKSHLPKSACSECKHPVKPFCYQRARRRQFLLDR